MPAHLTPRLVVFGGAIAGGSLALGLLAGAVWPRSAESGSAAVLPPRCVGAACHASAAPEPSATPEWVGAAAGAAIKASTAPNSDQPSPGRAGAEAVGAEGGPRVPQLPPDLKRLADEHRRRCSGSHSAPSSDGPARFRQNIPMTTLAASSLHGITANHRTGQPVVLLLTAAASSTTPQCSAGDVFEATAWSERNRAVVSVLDLGEGLHMLWFTPKIAGIFRFCLHLFRSARFADIGGWPSPDTLDVPYDRRAKNGLADRLLGEAKRSASLPDWCPSPKAETEPRCSSVTVTGSDVLPSTECPQDWRSGLDGSWVRAESNSCKPGLCRGDLRFMATDRWVWVPDECYLRLYNPTTAWNCLAGKHLVWFGDSTAKQPATDMVEMLLQVPVLRRSFRWQRDHCTTGAIYRQQMRDRRGAGRLSRKLAEMGCAIQFDHRQWLVTRTNPRNSSQRVRLRHIWGGGPTPPAGPGSSPRGLDLLLPESWPKQGRRSTYDVFSDALKSKPDAVFLHSYIWDDDATRYFARFEQKMQRVVNRTLAETPSTTRVHWATGHPQCIDDRDNPPSQCHTSVSNKLLSIQAFHNQHLIGRRVLPVYAGEGRVTMSFRYSMAEPHVMGPSFCHFGIHFGAHPQYCYMWEPADPSKCFRNWLVDKYEFMIWLNAVCPADSDLSSTFTGSMEDGVSPASEPQGGSATDNAF
eukprot:TRINITY_DN15630_c1_g1_i1.p1 TRINITY_DN15630_c1_g1~~TRINITY_DN15630_c1_g1_i1.p1  ORF type:complete len:713 (+),score=176.86 TRINITY_DN15630_c1_g1_i1:57-2141(+)